MKHFSRQYLALQWDTRSISAGNTWLSNEIQEAFQQAILGSPMRYNLQKLFHASGISTDLDITDTLRNLKTHKFFLTQHSKDLTLDTKHWRQTRGAVGGQYDLSTCLKNTLISAYTAWGQWKPPKDTTLLQAPLWRPRQEEQLYLFTSLAAWLICIWRHHNNVTTQTPLCQPFVTTLGTWWVALVYRREGQGCNTVMERGYLKCVRQCICWGDCRDRDADRIEREDL